MLLPLRTIPAWGLALSLLLDPLPAGATASLTCDVADRHLSLELLANMGRGEGGVIQLIGGTIKLKAIPGKYEAIEFNIEPNHISGNWSFGKELRIGIAPDAVKDVSIFFAIIAVLTKSGGSDMDRYRGTYVAKINGPAGASEFKGKLKGCEAG